ncbi:MAG TPA: MFS transporter, partial [Thermodesulfobacteriota bacterium]|nr:MFS transporter [Thermodesulfobacteriota bacterium]
MRGSFPPGCVRPGKGDPMAFRLSRPAPLSALAWRDYRLYWAGHFVSHCGNWIEVTATSWILYELTASPLLLGMNGLFRAAPLVGLTLVGGAVADRYPRRRLLLATETAMLLASAAVGLVAAGGRLAFWHLYALSLLGGVTAAFQVPARQALFPGLVERRDVQSAVALSIVAVRLAAFVGPVLAVPLLRAGYALPFLANAASYGFMLAALAAMRAPAGAAGAGRGRL